MIIARTWWRELSNMHLASHRFKISGNSAVFKKRNNINYFAIKISFMTWKNSLKKISGLNLPVRFYVWKNINFAHVQIYLCQTSKKWKKTLVFGILVSYRYTNYLAIYIHLSIWWLIIAHTTQYLFWKMPKRRVIYPEIFATI